MIINEGYVICSNDYKDSLLKEKKNGFVNYIYLTYDELLEKLTFKVDSKALLYLVEKYKFSYSLAKEYINKLKWINNKSYNNPKLEDISVIGKFDTIKDISITDMPVVDVSFLGNLVNLEQVSLNYLNISDVSSLNNNENLPKEIDTILNDFAVMQEDSVETLKKYL